MLSIYLQGLSLGLAYVAPIGMQNLFVINSAMSQKLRRALATALIVIFWDISLGLACFLGVGALMEALPWMQKIILGGGGVLVIYIGGASPFQSRPKRRKGCRPTPLEDRRLRFYCDMAEPSGLDRRNPDAGGFPRLPACRR